MLNLGSYDGIDLNLIDLDSSSSGPSSGEFYEPSSGVLRRARDTIDQMDELLGITRYLLRSRMTKPHTEPQPIQHSEHPENQQHTETHEHQQITEYPENQQQSVHRENQQNSEPPKHRQNTEYPENQQLSVLPENQQYSELLKYRGI